MKGLVLLIVWTMSSLAAAFSFDNDVPKDIQNQMLADLKFIGTIQSDCSSDFHLKIFGKVDGRDYTHFFETRVLSIGLSDCGNPKAVACVNIFNPSKMWITNNFIKFSHPQVARMMIVFHESRHTESQNGNWMHATCPNPFLDENGKEIKSIWTGSSLAGEPACDITPFGSYGSSMIMLKNISKFCKNCSEKVRQDAGIYADDQFKRVIDADAIAAIKQDLYNGTEEVIEIGKY